jgi:DNA-binding response OmpR family regulator
VAGIEVLALIGDLLFGSRVQATLTAAGHDVQLVGDGEEAKRRLAGTGSQPPPQVLVVDLGGRGFDGVRLVRDRRIAGSLAGTRTLGVYSHVDADTRRRAEQAGFDLVVPRSRMAREGAELVAGLLRADAPTGQRPR